ncbi:MAG: hypothetical protein ACRELZ_13695 [Candidatus Rokuibacteriota bacterium]
MRMILRRRALWALLGAKLVGGWGVGWDIRWHLVIGRDSFWIAPHVMTYASVVVVCAISLGVLLVETWRAREGAAPAGTIVIAGLRGTRGFHLAWWGMAIVILAAPIDDLWHRLFGLDVTLWSPPHLLGLGGSQISNLGSLLVALELYDAGWRRWVALAVGGIFFLGTFYILVDQSIQTAFHRGSVFFFAFPILGALAFTFALVLVARLAASRAMPLALAVGALLVQISILLIGDLGFALLQPTPAIEEAIAADPTSPVAVAHEMARRNGMVPGRSMILRGIPLLPAALMALADPRRRWRLSAAVFGLALVATSAIVLRRLPALSHALPSTADAAVATVVALVCAVGAGWCAVKVAAAFGRAMSVLRQAVEALEPAKATSRA